MMKASVALFAALLVCASHAQVPLQCHYTTPSGAVVDLSDVPTATLDITQSHQGVDVPFTFVANLCQAVNKPPLGVAECPNGAGYVSEYSPASCQTAFTDVISSWSYNSDKGMGIASFANSKGFLLNVFVGCGTTLELQAAGNVTVTDTVFRMYLTTSAACAGSTPLPPTPPSPPAPPANATCDVSGSTVSQLQPAILTINRQFQGSTQKFTWIIDLCQPTKLKPSSDATACTDKYPGPSYIQQYIPKKPFIPSSCVGVYDVSSKYGQKNGVWAADFASKWNHDTVTVIGQCADITELKSVGDVAVSVTNNGYTNSRFTFAAKAFCLSGAPTSKRVPPK